VDVRSPLIGRFNVSNLLAALAFAVAEEIEGEAAAAALGAMPGVPGRMWRVDAGQPFAVVVDGTRSPPCWTPCARSRPAALSSSSARRARGGDMLLLHPDRRAAIHAAVRAARPGDTVLLAGKGHERSITTGTTRLPWDDEAEARGPHISVTTPLCSTMAAVVSPTHL